MAGRKSVAAGGITLNERIILAGRVQVNGAAVDGTRPGGAWDTDGGCLTRKNPPKNLSIVQFCVCGDHYRRIPK